VNNRKRKKLSARRRTEYGRREGFHRLLDLVLDINGVEARKRSVSGNLPTAFFSFHGHTASAGIRIYFQGWGGATLPDYEEDIWDTDDINSRIKALEILFADMRSGIHE